MIDYLRHMAIFARVVDEGSFRGAAKSLNLAPSRISQNVSNLEDYLGVTLLYRTTRKISLTSEGKMFYNRVADMLRTAEAGLNDLNMLSLEPIGHLKMSLPAFMASSSISLAIAEFSRQYPQIKLSLSYSDRPVGLLDDGFDINIRVGWLTDSSMMARKLGEIERIIVAGSEYAKKHPEPMHPKDLESWDWINYQQRGDNIELTTRSGESEKISDQYQLQTDNIDAMLYFTKQNLGVSVLPWNIVEDGLQSGKLVQLLPDWKPKTLGYYAVWADTSRRESLTLLLVRFLADKEKKREALDRPEG
jgi:DNA-binding transcriptional LysR family regulator